MLPHFVNLLARSGHSFFISLGTTRLGFIAPFVVSVVSIVATLYSILRRHGADAMLARWKEDAAIAFKVAPIVTLAVYGPIFFYQGLVKTVYEDHESLAKRNQALLGIGQGNPYAITLNNEYASIVNTFIAFRILFPPEAATGARPRCRLRITADRNQTVAQELTQMARICGCSIDIPDRLSMDESQETQTYKAVPGVIIVRISTDRSEGPAFVTTLSNTFNVRSSHELPSDQPRDLIWLQIGNGVVWRK